MTATAQSSGSEAPTLRPYQHAALAAIAVELEQVRSTLVVIATGGGKAVIAAELIRRELMAGGRALLLAHREELLEQLRAKLAVLGVDAAIEQAGRRAGDARVVIASVPTLARPQRLSGFAPDEFTLIVADECHHCPAASWKAILDRFETAKLVGFTATPDRADGQGLGDLFETVAYRLEVRELIAMGFLVPLVARRIVLDGVDISRVTSRAGDLAQNELAEVMEAERAIAGVVTPLLEHAGDRPTVAFAASVEHAARIAAAINRQRSDAARVIHGELKRDIRRELMRGFRAREFQYLVNVDVMTEGVDVPEVSCVAMIRPTKSRGRYVQGAGRGLRPAPWIGKRDCLLLDFSPTAGKHRLIGPVDCLVGDLPDDLRAELDLLLGRGECRLEQAVREATGAVEKQRIEISVEAKVRWHAEQVDPFIGQATLDDAAGTRAGWSEALATEAQRRAIAAHGLNIDKLPPQFSMADASRLLRRLEARKAAGLCSLAAARQIARAGIDTRMLSAQRAQQMLGKLRKTGWSAVALHGEPEANTPEALARRRQIVAAVRERKVAKAARASRARAA